MDQATKDRLKAAAQAKRLKARQANPLAKDYAPEEWLILLDAARDKMHAAGFAAHESDPPTDYFDRPVVAPNGAPTKHGGVTLKYVGDAVIEALATVLPSVKVRYQVGPNRVRVTRVFPHDVIIYLMKELRLDTSKYTSDAPASWLKYVRLS